jgi:polysaccharide export outer membrane protein
MRSKFLPLSLLLILLLVSSCATRKDVAYIQTPEEIMTIASDGLQDARILPKDLLTITIESSNPEAVAAFNGIYWNPQQQYASYGQEARTFLVDNEGRVDLPVVGMTDLGGLTLRQAEARIKVILGRYINDITAVNVKIKNYKYSVIGQVKRPGTYTSENTKVSVFEALANAGDMTIQGVRDEVKLMREDPNGERRIVTLNLQDPAILSSPYYYLQQGDVLYVIPNNAAAQSSNIGAATGIIFSIASLTLSVANILINILVK